jgi:hypothetical protein
MNIFEGSITQLASEGYLTLQVPHCVVGEPTPDTVEVPDEWLCELKSDVPVTGRQEGFLFLTRAGYEANKDAIKKAFEKACANGKDRTDGEGWAAFEKRAEEHFKHIEERCKKRIAKLEKDLETLKDFEV